MQKWEYKILKEAPSEAELNKLGAEGWELIVIAGAVSEYYDIRYYFKRPK
jgi:hypothetical protein